MSKELAKTYDPLIVEDMIYNNWLEKKYFHALIDENKEPFTIVIPPPNITGALHMGHAYDNTLQDILIRFKRMDGYSALWVPGTDHASISTELKIVESLAKEGLTKDDLTREEFLERAWEWKEEHGNKIVNQLKKLGCSLDFDRERFTLDEGLSDAVNTVFERLYKEGLIYKGEKIINCCTECKTSLSDAEVEHVDREGHFWHIKYPLSDGSGYLEIATTRPETMLADTAVMVHPLDERYQKYIGKTVILPLMNKEIMVIADEHVDMEFGTAIVKVTPGHDPNDFLVGERHGLEIINIMTDDGYLNENAGKYAGLERFEARKIIEKDLEEAGFLLKVEKMTHSIGVHERCNSIIEPLVKLQWFVKMEDLAKPAIEAYKSGELKFHPDRFSKVYLNWLENIRDWCISRQLYWGHRIPAYYCDNCGNIEVSAKNDVEKCSKCGHKEFTQDEDTLDTWFSSALWPFSTLGWPEETEDFKYFYPTNVLVTAYDIIFFWVVRMVFSAIHNTGKLPFNDVIIHGLIRDAEGRKFSKSLGNGIDPLDAIEKYGADALRLTLVSGTSAGNDMRFYWDKIENSRNFSNKIWNATRFVLMNYDKNVEDMKINLDDLQAMDKWILSKANSLSDEISNNIEKFDLGLAVNKVYDFLWDEYCDWYIEMVKPRLYDENDKTRDAALWTLVKVLKISLKLLHPFMPFITEELYMSIQSKDESIMISKWPRFKKEYNFEKEEKEVEILKEAVRNIRNVRAEMNVPPSKKVSIYLIPDSDESRAVFENSTLFFTTLASVSELIFATNDDEFDESFVSTVVPTARMFMPFEDLVDIEKEIKRLEEEKAKLNDEIARVDKKLSNPSFIEKAPDKIVNSEKEKKEKYIDMLKQLEDRLANLVK